MATSLEIKNKLLRLMAATKHVCLKPQPVLFLNLRKLKKKPGKPSAKRETEEREPEEAETNPKKKLKRAKSKAKPKAAA